MRTSEYYAAGIRSFFVDFALDALDQDPSEAVVARLAVTQFAPDAEYDFEFGDCTGCSCAVTAYPPCWHCENDHDEGNVR